MKNMIYSQKTHNFNDCLFKYNDVIKKPCDLGYYFSIF